MRQLHAESQQRGAVLVVSLIVLLLLTILAITASNTATLQERMASNAQEANVAFQAAESGLSSMTNPLQDTATAPGADTLVSLVYPTRTIRVRAQSSWRYTDGSSLDVKEGTPVTIVYDMSSRATLDPNATSAGLIIDSNTNALHLQGYRDRIIR